DLVSERDQIVCQRKRRRAGADASNALAVLLHRRSRQPRGDVAFEIRRDTLQATDRHGLAVDARAATRWLARPIARAPQDCGEDVRLSVEHVRIRVPTMRDEPDVLRDVRVGRASPLAVDDFVEVIRIPYVGGLHETPYLCDTTSAHTLCQ